MTEKPSVERVVVSSFDGLFDEEAKAILHNIADRRLCVGRFGRLVPHTWINGSLRFEKRGIYLNLQSPGEENYHPEWGKGYGGIRYCERCKEIDCIHLWDRTTTYAIEHGKYYATERIVSHCRVCDRRIARGGSGVCRPSPEAQRLIAEIAQERGEPLVYGNYGSAYFCELPVAVSEVIDAHGVEAARRYVQGQFGERGCEAAFRHVRGSRLDASRVAVLASRLRLRAPLVTEALQDVGGPRSTM